MNVKDNVIQEKELKAPKGIGVLLLTILLYILSIVGVILSVVMELLPLGIVCGIYMCLGWIPWCGIKVLNPNEAYVLTLFGKYVGTLKHEGIFFVVQ